MPRVIVTTESPTAPSRNVLLDERVQMVHLASGHAAAQLIERLAWAISDAEDAERERAARGSAPAHAPRKTSSQSREARAAIAA